jgi:hypothetical protein
MNFTATILASLLLATCTGICAAHLSGQLNVISQNESIELFNVTSSGHDFYQVFSAQLDLQLRQPCPFCHPTYDLVRFEDQILIPSSGVLSIFTFLSMPPFIYTQSVPIPDCEPLSIVKSLKSPNVLFMDCLDLENSGNYFLAELVHSSDDTGHQWTFEKISGFKTLERAGTYVEVASINSIMMLYVHEEYDYIQMNGFRSGYINIISRPDGCNHVVRITATGSINVMLLECSASNDSELVSSIYVLESVTTTHILDTIPYSVCPIRFTMDGDTAAIFTEYYIIVINLVSYSFTNISVSQAIYDGAITRFDNNSFYLVYVTSRGLHRDHLTEYAQETGSSMTINSQLLFPDTSTVCAVDGCSLLTLIDSDTVLVALDYKIAIFSISALEKVAPYVRTKHQPSRNIFQKKYVAPIDHPNHVTTVVPSSTTKPNGYWKTDAKSTSTIPKRPSPKPTLPLYVPPKESAKPKDGYAIQDKKRKSPTGIVVPAVVAAVLVAVFIVAIIILKRRYPRRRKMYTLKASYSCGSDNVCLLETDTLMDNHSPDSPAHSCNSQEAVKLEGEGVGANVMEDAAERDECGKEAEALAVHEGGEEGKEIKDEEDKDEEEKDDPPGQMQQQRLGQIEQQQQQYMCTVVAGIGENGPRQEEVAERENHEQQHSSTAVSVTAVSVTNSLSSSTVVYSSAQETSRQRGVHFNPLQPQGLVTGVLAKKTPQIPASDSIRDPPDGCNSYAS